MKKFKIKRCLPALLAVTLTFTSLPMIARADSAKVVTLGANLSEEQKNSMYEYFGTSADEVETIEVTNQDERKYMEGIATEAQIGTRTYSCSYVEPTDDGGIQVKVANLTFVTSSMIASTLLTSGVENCNVIAASPIEVSGTGALTGIMMAYESASGEELDEDQKAAATEELVTTGELADEIGQEQASELMNQVKQEVIEDDLSEKDEIEDTVTKAASDVGVDLTDEQIAQITSLMQNIAQYDYDVKALKKTLDNLNGKEEGFFSKLVSSITGIFGKDNDGGIINNTNDSILGDDAVVDSTLDTVKKTVEDASEKAEKEGFFDKIINFFKDLFGGDDEESSDDSAVSEEAPDADAASEDTSGEATDDPGPMNAGDEDNDDSTDTTDESSDNSTEATDDPGPMNAGDEDSAE
ncbi:MAG: DUF1002 domain-containing protein [Lachnospiraceae bacterium]